MNILLEAGAKEDLKSIKPEIRSESTEYSPER